MKNLFSRVTSALIALVILFFAVYYGQETGVYILTCFAVLRCSFEIARMFFNSDYPAFSKNLFIFICVSVFLIISQENFRFLTSIFMILSFVLITCLAILFHKKFKTPELVLTYIAKNCLALVYVCFLPATVTWILQTNYGLEWFLCLLAVVFAGDIGAFIFGVKFGKTKIAPVLSPNKSLQGSLGGLAFSTLAAFLFQFLIPNVPVSSLIICGLLGGFLGQIGDFFESLIKRVSGVKDSGTIMPGHGGVLDRLDGVLLAAPLFYIVSNYFSL